MNARGKTSDQPIPVLTETVDPDVIEESSGIPEAAAATIDDLRLAELQTELAAKTYELTDRLLHTAFSEMEAALFEQVSSRLRKELPDLVDQILREQFGLQEE